MNRKVDFLSSKETDASKLKLSLQEQFTKLVIKRVVIELARSKAEVTAKLEYLASLDDQVLKEQAVLQEKTFKKNKQVTEAESRVNDLVGVVNEHLAEIREEDPEVGSLRHTLGLLEEFLSQSVISLPKVIDGVRTNTDSEKSIYKSEYDQLPQAVKECFDESVALINLANEAAAAEKVAVAEYKLVHDKINEDSGEQITDLREKITLIEEAEAIAGKIVEAQTFWRYEGVPAPGDDKKIPMNASTSQKIVKELEGISTDLEDLDLETNIVRLQEEIISAKEYIQKLKSALVVYTNISAIQTAIYEAEASITIYERVIARRIKEAEADAATSRKERNSSATRDSRRTSSSDVFAKEMEDDERRRRKQKAEETRGKSDVPDLVDEVMRIKLKTANAPLVSTRAGQYSVKKSMNPMSSRVGVPGRGGDGDPYDSDDEGDHDDRDKGRKGRDRDDDDNSGRGRDQDKSKKKKKYSAL